MFEEFYTQVGNFLAPVLQGIMIYVISHILIEIFKNRKQKDKKDGSHPSFFVTLMMRSFTPYATIIYHLATKYKNCFVTAYEG